MSDNTTKIVLHIDNSTGRVIRSEQEDAFGALRETNGNFNDLILTYGAPVTQMHYRVGEAALDSTDDEVQSSEIARSVAPLV